MLIAADATLRCVLLFLVRRCLDPVDVEPGLATDIRNADAVAIPGDAADDSVDEVLDVCVTLREPESSGSEPSIAPNPSSGWVLAGVSEPGSMGLVGALRAIVSVCR